MGFFIGIYLCSLAGEIYAVSVRVTHSACLLLVYGVICLGVIANSQPELSRLFTYYPGFAIYCLVMMYQDEKSNRISFLKDKKIKRLMNEQRDILNKMPDGLILHKKDESSELQPQNDETELNFINQTFYDMFVRKI